MNSWLARVVTPGPIFFRGIERMNSDLVANTQRSHAVQELRTWICVTEFFVVVVGFWHFTLRSRIRWRARISVRHLTTAYPVAWLIPNIIIGRTIIADTIMHPSTGRRRGIPIALHTGKLVAA